MTVETTSLLSTVAGVSSTLVAIIGGFLLNRVLVAGQDRRQLLAEAAALAGRLEILNHEVGPQQQTLLEGEALAWLRQAIEIIVGSWGQLTMAEVVEDVPWDGDLSALRPYFERATGATHRWRLKFEPLFVEGEHGPPDLEELVDLRSLEEMDVIVAWMVYIRLTNEFADKPSMWLTIPFSKPEVVPTPVELVVDERQVRRQAQQRLDDRRGDQRLLQESLRQVRDRVQVATIGPEAWWGVGALTLLTVLGVAPPILYLGRRESDVGATSVAVVLTLFAIAILALLTYLVGLIVWAQRLGATADRPPAPALPADPETLPAASG